MSPVIAEFAAQVTLVVAGCAITGNVAEASLLQKQEGMYGNVKPPANVIVQAVAAVPGVNLPLLLELGEIKTPVPAVQIIVGVVELDVKTP